MTSSSTACVIFASVFGSSLVAMRLRAALPSHHLTTDTKDTVKLTMGLVATMAALVLGLLVASAKGSYDAEHNGMTQMAASIIFLDRMLASYGPEAAESRETLRQIVERLVARLWPDEKSQPSQLDVNVGSDTLMDQVQRLTPKNDEQREIKSRVIENMVKLGEMRWLMFEQSGTSISTPMLVIVVCWLSLLFISFGLFAPANGTAIASLMVGAVSVSGAIFLILELDHPLSGLIRISSVPMRIALAHLGK